MPRESRLWGASCVTSTPETKTFPDQTRSRPAAALMAVDLPAPFGPMTAAIWPFLNVLLAFVTTVTWVYPVLSDCSSSKISDMDCGSVW